MGQAGPNPRPSWETDQPGPPPNHPVRDGQETCTAVCPQDLLTLLQRIRDFVFESAYFSLGSRDLAEDVAQESLTRVLSRLLKDEISVENLAAYVCGIAKHVIADTQRWESRRVGLDVDKISEDELPSSLGAPAGDPWADGLSSMVIQEVEKLPEADRKVLKGCFIDGFSCAELGRRSGEPAPRIRKRKSRALRRLRDQVRERPEFSAYLSERPH
jgi:RNA polymerase sigma factor (sigma-70 family)